jgi:hypothetical protein
MGQLMHPFESNHEFYYDMWNREPSKKYYAIKPYYSFRDAWFTYCMGNEL